VKDIIAEIRRWKNENKGGMEEIIVEGVEHGIEDIAGTFKCKVSTKIEGEVEEVVSSLQPNFAVIGPRYREKAKEIVAYIKKSHPAELWDRIKKGEAEIAGIKITEDMVKVQREKRYKGKRVHSLSVGDSLVLIF